MQKSVYSEEYRQLCDLLRGVRTNAGLSQRAMAERLGVPHTWVSKVESGERRLDLIECLRICRATGADPQEVLAPLLVTERPKKRSSPSAGTGRTR
jgi:transcriptional regulator with XRE-family HTH domain